MTPLLVLLITACILAVFVTIAVLLYRRKWWPLILVVVIAIALIILLYYLPAASVLSTTTTTTKVHPLDTTPDTTLLVPIYIFVLSHAVLVLIILMLCGTMQPSTEAQRSGRTMVASLLAIVFVLFLVTLLPPIYIWYRVAFAISSIFVLGIMIASTLLGVLSFFMRRRPILSRQYGFQTLSHVLYYFAVAAIMSAASNCETYEDVVGLLAAGVLAAMCATSGIIVESNAWSVSS